MFYTIKGMKPLKPETLTSLSEGLTSQQASSMPANQLEQSQNEPLSTLIFRQFFTFFNIINYILAALIIFTGSYRNLMFMIVVLSNTLIGLIQKIRSRRTLERLALVHQQTYSVLRNGKWEELPIEQIVCNDIVSLKAGSQIPCDCVIREGFCQVNESLLTGESDPLDRSQGQSLYGGCYLISGQVLVQAVLVGTKQYMAGIITAARRDKEHPSELRDMLNALIRFCSMMLFPAGILLFIRLNFFSGVSLNTSILNTCASMIGMIPEGLMILTSTALAAASVKMARKAVLIHDLYSIEGLARVDTLCLDKTGTITSGKMNVTDYAVKDGQSVQAMKQDLADLFGSLEDDNITARALRASLADLKPKRKADRTFPFSSVSKFSGCCFGDETLVFGAYTFIFAHPDPEVLKEIDSYAARGLRILALARKNEAVDKLEKGDFTLIGLVLIEDEIRPDAPCILNYFKEQDVQIKIISGDMARTVQAIADRAGIEGEAVDMQNVSNEQIPELVKRCSIFGRVSPEQKMEMVKALKEQGHTVGMTGDGVNDVMALKEADCSIAMGSGAQAALAVSSLVLLQDQFSILPSVVNQGRCVINNIQRTASLFLVKTIFSVILAILTVIWLPAYPFIPIQLTLVSSLGTGIPAFILTFENDTSRPKGSFMVSVLSRALPGALAICGGICLAALVCLSKIIPMDTAAFQTICTMLAAVNSICVLYWICRPLSFQQLVVVIFCSLGFVVAIVWFHGVFSLTVLNFPQFVVFLCVLSIQIPLFLQLEKIHWADWIEEILPARYKGSHAAA